MHDDPSQRSIASRCNEGVNKPRITSVPTFVDDVATQKPSVWSENQVSTNVDAVVKSTRASCQLRAYRPPRPQRMAPRRYLTSSVRHRKQFSYIAKSTRGKRFSVLLCRGGRVVESQNWNSLCHGAQIRRVGVLTWMLSATTRPGDHNAITLLTPSR